MDGFPHKIHKWFLVNKRDLPWRNTQNPYKIWLSEIILQQTRVAQGIKYYQSFVEYFPTINDLAIASEDEVLKLWQGLGYYSRARNLHYTAKYISSEYDGKFPTDYDAILKLKGIGPYTAAAISSIAFNLPRPAVDGNIYRLFSRYFGIEIPIDSNEGKKEFSKIAEDLIFNENPGMHNQALMEFGALQCVPKSPNCNICPVADSCHSFINGTVDALPVKFKKVKQTKRYFYYYYINQSEFTFLEKRTQNDIWKNLYQFPMLETEEALTEKEILNSGSSLSFNLQGNIKSISTVKKHILSHQIIYARIIHIEIENSEDLSSQFIQVNKKDISKFAVPRLLEQFMVDLDII